MRLNIKELKGKTFTDVYKNEYNNLIYFVLENGDRYVQYHDQDCCETVTIDDITGDLIDLMNTPILVAEERISHGDANEYVSSTWTFYEFRTIKGSVTIKWYGESNGYYSESVDLKFVAKNDLV
ncbi:MAG: hypothetical protein COA52_01280 [Hyphomicrobiales bacterium]|nr:MAG: hypothetical protein COA52_00190 [Hyphomicrobiales bacterium]PCJ96865.1 MAG: hypothetical protein COA52_01280 [Hyphomicrobiales bacterium]